MISSESSELIRCAEILYEQCLKNALEVSHRDDFIAIEPESGDYFLGKTLSEAAAAARKAYPTRRTHLIRIGHRAGIHLGAGKC